jgi:signal transduction histidine kinase
MTRRLLVSFMAIALLALALLEIPLGVANARSERRDLEAKVERDAVAVASLAQSAVARRGASVVAVARLAETYLDDTGGRIVVVDRAGRALVDADPPAPGPRSFASRPEIASALRGRVATGVRHSETLGADLLYVAVPVAANGVVSGAVRVSYPTSAIDERVRRYWLALAAIAAVVLALAAVVAVVLARWIAGPLEAIERAAAAAAEGDLGARATAGGPPEVRSLALTLNDLVARVDALLGSQRDFVADASHQLRTPLTALRLRLENLEREVAAGGRADLDGALAEVQRLSGLVDGLLALARADAGETPARAVDVAGAARERLAAWRPLAAERGVELRLAGGEPPRAHVGPGRLEQVLDNLLSNALEVAPPGTAVTLTTGRAGDRVELRVADEGPGLAPEDRARAFDRFWRGASDGAGSGLGLAIARRLVETDGGEIELGEAPGGGLEARIRLPRA